MVKHYRPYKRKKGKKEPYYMRFRDPETGERMSGLSTHTNIIDVYHSGKDQLLNLLV